MDPQLLIILFLLFGVISSLINKLQERRHNQPDESKLKRKARMPKQTRPPDPFEEDEEVDWSDWDVFTETRKPEPAPPPELKPEALPTPPEFQPVSGKRPVTEEDTGPEFREIRGARPVEEPKRGTEFREVEATRPVSDQSSYVEGKTPFVRASMDRPLKRTRRKRRLGLDFKPETVRKAIIYNEIIGPPRADAMPF